MNNKLYLQSFAQNRELSWLKFNERVLEEGEDESVPILERLKFISIFTSNLDEFFMIRVGSLFDLKTMDNEVIDNKSGMTPSQQLKKIYKSVHTLYEKRENIYSNVEKQLRLHGIYSLEYNELEISEQKYIKKYFKTNIAPILSPQIVDSHHPFPHLQNKIIHIGILLKNTEKEVFGIIPVPSSLPNIIFLPGSDVRFISVEKVILAYAERIFYMYEVLEKVCFCITRNSDINTDDEMVDVGVDFRKKMKTLLRKRRRLAVVRLELTSQVSETFLNYMCEKFAIEKHQIFQTKVPLDLKYAFSIDQRLPEFKRNNLTYNYFEPQVLNQLNMNESIIKQVSKKDILLHYPYESMEPFLLLLKEAAFDHNVISIKITIYRLASKAKLVDYICAAAENGKDVTVLIELRARFDEQNNIYWSERLEDAGCKVIYGFDGYKVHSKICLITCKDKNDVKYITQIGTGNYNEKTASMYTDLSLITANKNIGEDATEFFKNMAIGNLEGKYSSLLVAPVCLKSTIISLIDDEIAKKDNGRIVLKVNSITDADIISKLSEASCAGVKIQLIVRGICCILPDVKGKTENITVTSIVGRFLEHSRIYCFGKNNDEKIYISSADFMTRNTERRVEIACPIFDENIMIKIRNILDVQIYDNIKARVLCADGNYSKKKVFENKIDSQKYFMEEALNKWSKEKDSIHCINKIMNQFKYILLKKIKKR